MRHSSSEDPTIDGGGLSVDAMHVARRCAGTSTIAATMPDVADVNRMHTILSAAGGDTYNKCHSESAVVEGMERVDTRDTAWETNFNRLLHPF